MKKIFITFIMMFIMIPNANAAIADQINSLNSSVNTLTSQVNNLSAVNKLYPVGSIYISTSSTNPSSLFGGTWQAYAPGRKIVGVGSNGKTTYNYNASGGSSTKTISTSNMPSHNHTITPAGTVTSTFKGSQVTSSSGGIHSHTVPFGKASNEASGYGLLPFSSGGDSYYDRVLVTTDYNKGIRFDPNTSQHNHTLTSSGTVTSTFTAKSATTSSKGSTSSFSIQNPYIVVYMWKRTA